MIAPSRRGIFLLCINAVFCPLATLAFLIRFLNNLSRARKGLLPWGYFLSTETLVFAATALVNLNGAFRIVSIILGGVGFDSNQLTPDQIEWALKALFIEELAWTTSLCLLKFALIIIYGRVFVSNTANRKRRGIQTFAAIVVFTLLTGSITYYLTECTPLEASWKATAHGTCQSPRAGWLGTSIANLVTDVIIFSVPIASFADLKMHLHNKITVGIQLFVGASVSTISFTRIFFVLRVVPDNITGSVVNADIFSCMELTMAIIFASIAGIAGREAISSFVDRFIVAKPKYSSRPKAKDGFQRFNPGDQDFPLQESPNSLESGTLPEDPLDRFGGSLGKGRTLTTCRGLSSSSTLLKPTASP